LTQTVSATDIALRQPSNAFESSKYFRDSTLWNSLQIGKSEKMHFLDITPLSTNWFLRHRLECLHIWLSFLVAFPLLPLTFAIIDSGFLFDQIQVRWAGRMADSERIRSQ
jgi:hypothetical protein